MSTTFHAHAQGHQGRISKYKARSTVKPILKKLHSSHSEKNSLDLNRGWEEQQTHPGYTNRRSHDNQQATLYSPTVLHSPTGRGNRDVSFDLSTADPKASTIITTGTTTAANSTSATSASSSTAAISSSNINNSNNNNNNNTEDSSPAITSSKLPYRHARSTSGTSQFSVATTNSGRNGSFVHPFQQTPRTSTPPLLSYATSLASLDTNNPQRDYPPNTITENEDDNIDPLGLPISTANSSGPRVYQSPPPQSQSHPAHRGRPPASNQRASSMTDVVPSVRTTTGRASSVSIPRLVTTTTNTSGDASPSIHARSAETGHFGNVTPSVTVVDESPLSTTTSAAFGMSPQLSAGTSGSNHHMSPLRSSLDMTGFRIRSRSDVDTATRQEHVRAARRKFEEKERAKEEKYTREQVRKRERADSKEAQRIEKAHSRHRGSHSARNSTSEPRPSFARVSTNHSRLDEQDEKAVMPDAEPTLSGRLYDEMASGSAPNPRADHVHFESSKRQRSGKRKTTGTWTAFVLWFRTRLLKLGRR